MEVLFYVAGILAIISTLMVITRKNAVHALLYLIVSLLSISVIFFILGAPFVAALEVIIYAGAIMVLFVFVIMMLSGEGSAAKEGNSLLEFNSWVGPSLIALILLGEMLFMLLNQDFRPLQHYEISPAAVGKMVFTQYALIVDLAGFLLIAGVIGAYHLGQKERKSYHRYLQDNNQNA